MRGLEKVEEGLGESDRYCYCYRVDRLLLIQRQRHQQGKERGPAEVWASTEIRIEGEKGADGVLLMGIWGGWGKG